MIDINGCRFRKLTDPIYANGRRVKKVLCNGVKVYPDVISNNSEGRLIKILGWTNVYVTHTHDGVRPVKDTGWYDIVYYKEGEYSFGVMASFAATIKFRQPAKCILTPTAINLQEKGHPARALNTYTEDRILFGTRPLAGLQDQYAKCIMPVSNTALVDYVDFIYKESITPPPVCSYYFYRHHASFQWLSESYCEFTPKEPYLYHACEFNAKVFSKRWENIRFCMDTSYTIDYGRLFYDRRQGEFGSLETKAIVDTECPRVCNKATNTLYGMSIHLGGYSTKYDRKDLYSGSITNDYCNANLSDIIALIPITHILYVGSEEEAPDWAKTVSEDDLF